MAMGDNSCQKLRAEVDEMSKGCSPSYLELCGLSAAEGSLFVGHFTTEGLQGIMEFISLRAFLQLSVICICKIGCA